jgi:hypothetical protein
MNVFSLQKDIRPYGFNCGLPVMSVTFGPGLNIAPEELVTKMAIKGLRKGGWVLLKEGLGERGLVTVVDALKFMSVGVEIECSTSGEAPKFFPKVDKWTLLYKPKGSFSLGQLRPKQDIVLCETSELPGMLKALQGYSHVDRGILVRDTNWSIDEAWENKVRVYFTKE